LLSQKPKVNWLTLDRKKTNSRKSAAMGSLKSQQRIPMRTSYGGRSSLSGRKDKRLEASYYNISLPLILVIISVVAVVGILKLEHLSQHISISIPRRSRSHTRSSIGTAQDTKRASTMPPSRLSNTAAEPEAPVMPASVLDDADADDDSIHPPAFEPLSLGLQSKINPRLSEPSIGSGSPEAPQLLNLGSSHQQQHPHHMAQEQQPAPETAATLQHIAASTSASESAIVSAPVTRNRLLLATHSRLMWYYPDTDEYRILHEGEVRPLYVVSLRRNSRRQRDHQSIALTTAQSQNLAFL
jgi:hypothetical protein